MYSFKARIFQDHVFIGGDQIIYSYKPTTNYFVQNILFCLTKNCFVNEYFSFKVHRLKLHFLFPNLLQECNSSSKWVVAAVVP